MQLFVGVWPPSKVQKAIAEYPRPAVPDVRWSTPSQWLVNIRPLGDVHTSIVPGLVEALRFELDGEPKVRAAFGPVYREGWLMVPVTGLEELTAVVFEATEPLVPVTHRQQWHAQLALARATRCPPELVQPISASWTVGSVSLAKGTRGKDGPGYEDVEVFALGP